jgi:hypothetical protein
MYHAIHGSHVSGTDRRLSYSQHDKYMYVSCHSWITCQEPTDGCLIVNMISTGMYHAIHGSHVRNQQKIGRQSSVGSWHVIHEWHNTYMYLSCWLEDNLVSVPDMCSMNGMIHQVCIMPFMVHISGTDRRLSYNQHDKYRYVSCHSWITCQEPTEDCLLLNMISTGMYHAIDPWMAWYIPVLIMLTRRQSSVSSWHGIHEWHDTYLYLSCWLEDNLLSVPDMWSMNGNSQHDKYMYISCHSWITC